ncbi:unnamed protein product [Parajaminaea phylloscopi]
MLLHLLLFVVIPSLLSCIALLFLFLYVALYRASSITRRTSLGRSAVVVVLGDVGRSPRMCYHIESLADQGWRVSVVGYGGSSLPPSIQRSSVRFLRMEEVPQWIGRLPRLAFVAVAPFKLLWQSAALFWKVAMVVQPPPEIILVQTPPALPTLLVVRLCSLLLSSRVIIDWHNLAYTILALRLGKGSLAVSIAAFLERWTGRTAFGHLFVTHAMREELESKWKLRGHKAVLHDRPPKHFRQSTVRESHRLWTDLAPTLTPSLQDWWPQWEQGRSTPFTELDPHSGQAVHRADRPAVAVSSTSWTTDEDFGVLLKAAQLYERRAREINERTASSTAAFSDAAQHHKRSSTGFSSNDGSFPLSSSPPRRDSASTMLGVSLGTSSPERNPSPGAPSSPRGLRKRRYSTLSLRPADSLPNLPARSLPRLLIVVTGKGGLRAQYEAEIARLEREEKWEYVRIRTAWLESSQYPVLLGSADVGISLHTSSSGLDLPMKVVDMLGCRLPVLALDFPCLAELIQHGKNGLTFKDDATLSACLESLLADFPYIAARGDTGGPSCDGQNWLAKRGGLRDPFALAGNPLTSVEGATSGTRQSLEVGAALEDEEDRPLLNRHSLDFSKGGLPTSNSAGSMSGSSSPSSSFWKRMSGNGGETADAARIHRPTTPTPAFTMLASPILQSSAWGQEAAGPPGTSTPQADASGLTWSENWKVSVRPLLRLADEEDARAEGISLSDEEVPDSDLDDELGGETYATQAPPNPLIRASGMLDGGMPRPDGDARASTTPTKRKTGKSRRLGSDGRPLRIRGGSVHGLLWSEDFQIAGVAGKLGFTQCDPSLGENDEEDEDEVAERDLLSSLGIVMTGGASAQRRRLSASAGTGTASMPSTPKAKLRKSTTFCSPAASHHKKTDDPCSGETFADLAARSDSSYAGRDTSTSTMPEGEGAKRQQQLRHRTNKSAVAISGETGLMLSASDSIPDIRVSQVETEDGGL